MMNKRIDKIKGKLFEMGALIILKNKGLVDDKEFFILKKDIEKEYFIDVG